MPVCATQLESRTTRLGIYIIYGCSIPSITNATTTITAAVMLVPTTPPPDNDTYAHTTKITTPRTYNAALFRTIVWSTVVCMFGFTLAGVWIIAPFIDSTTYTTLDPWVYVIFGFVWIACIVLNAAGETKNEHMSVATHVIVLLVTATTQTMTLGIISNWFETHTPHVLILLFLIHTSCLCILSLVSMYFYMTRLDLNRSPGVCGAHTWVLAVISTCPLVVYFVMYHSLDHIVSGWYNGYDSNLVHTVHLVGLVTVYCMMFVLYRIELGHANILTMTNRAIWSLSLWAAGRIYLGVMCILKVVFILIVYSFGCRRRGCIPCS